MTNTNAISNIDWFVTRICNQAKYCKFCYAPWNAFPPDVPLEGALRICDRLIELGVKTLTLCGGEPTQYAHITEVVQKLAPHTNVAMLTNTVSVPNFDWDSVLPHLYMLCLSLDAASPEIVELMRGAHQLEGVCKMLRRVSSLPKRPLVKIGTVVSRQNARDLGNLLDLLASYNCVDVWRLYQFSPYGLGKTNEKLFLIEDDEFLAAVSEVKRRAPAGLNVAERSRNDNQGYCRIMDSVGGFYRYEERYIPLGVSVFDTPDQILQGYDNEKNDRQKAWHEPQASATADNGHTSLRVINYP